MQKVWQSQNYYHKVAEASQNLDHSALRQIKKLAQKSNKILEVGCGEGTKLNQISDSKNNTFGIDVSSVAIKIAKKKYPKINFKICDAKKLSFEDNNFDLVYSAFVLEHTFNPELVLKEMIRVVKVGGKICLLAPNYGAPFRKSPCFKGNRIRRIFKGLCQDFKFLFNSKSDKLNWQKVKPRLNEEFQIDFDTLIEPYLLSLVKFLRSQNVKLLKISSCWEIGEENAKMINKIFRLLGKLSIYPFKYWGPHLFVVCEKL
jgi:ubiquinone/menaquinone biosynthesis C-methylase UbiE